MTSNAEHLRDWLLACGAVDGAAGFGVDFLGERPGSWSLRSVASPVRCREDILGRVLPEAAQVQDFLLESRQGSGDARAALDALARYEAAARKILRAGAAGDLPQWEGGTVTGVVPVLTPAPGERSAGTAGYRMQIRVRYRVE